MQETSQIHKGHLIEIVFSGAPGWFDFYVDGKPWGCARPNKIWQRINEVIALKTIANQQPEIDDQVPF